MSARGFFFALSFLIAVCGCGVPQPSAQADAILTPLYEAGVFSGAVIIGSDGEIVYERAFGTADGEAPFAATTASDGASLAKPITAATILLLASEGVLDLDEAAKTYIPEVPLPDITLRDLISHAAGLPDYDQFTPLLESGIPVTTADLLNALAAEGAEPAFPAGTAFSYCNLCYDVLGLVIERVSQQPLADTLDGRFFSRLGMQNAFLRPAKFEDWPTRRTLAFRRGTDGVLVEFGAYDNEAFHGASNIYLSARDLHAWASAWTAGRALPLSADAIALDRARIGSEHSGLTLGSWYCDGDRPRCYYTGHHRGFFGLVYWNRESGATLALVSNMAISPHLHADLPRALAAIAEGCGDRRLLPAPIVDAVDPMTAAGDYRAPTLGGVTLTAENRILFFDPDQGPRVRLYEVDDGVFYAPGYDGYLRFTPAQNTVLQGFRWTTLFVDVEAKRVRTAVNKR